MTSTVLLSDNGVSSGSAGFKSQGGNDGTLLLQTSTSGGTATTAVTLDNNQNMGLGVTPSAWAYPALQLGNGAFFSRPDPQVGITQNAYSSTAGGGWKYVATAAASYYNQSAGAHAWFNAISGTAGNSISWTQAMTLDTTGVLTVGATKIEAGPGYAGVNTTSAVPFIFYNNGSEKARIDSSGNLLVGTTSSSGKLTVSETTNASQVGYFENTNASFTNRVLSINASRNTTNGTYKFLECSISAVAVKLSIADSGNVTNTNGSYGTISDIKVKENIVDATPKLNDVMRLQVRNFNLKSEPEHKQIGFVAQELEQVFPSMVEESFDRDEEGNILEETTKSIKTSVLIPVLVKAIQEQQAIIQTLTERVAALEGAK